MLQTLQLRARLESELVDERRARGAECGERIGLPPAAVQSEHLKPAQALAQRMRRDERLELGRRLGRATAVDVGADPALERREPQLVQPRSDRPHGRHVRHVRERGAAPERQRGVELSSGRGGASGRMLGHAG